MSGTTSYRGEVGVALEVLAEGLAPFVDREMRKQYPNEDWIVAAATRLGKREPVLASPTDPQFQLEVMIRWWGPVFARVLSKDTRDTIQDLRKARNEWAHIDDSRPIDLEYARRIHSLAEDLLQEIGSSSTDAMMRLAEDLQRRAVSLEASERGISESDVLIMQLTDLQSQREQLARQLDEAHATAQSAVGRQRAAARQLAELQAQYAAVSGLRERYRELQERLDAVRPSDPGGQDGAERAPTTDPIDDMERAIQQLQAESTRLHAELETTRMQLATVDPFETAAGKRWLMLVAAFIMVLGVFIFVVSQNATL